MDLLELLEVQTNPICPHAVSLNNGGWSFDRESALWVHAHPDCGRPKHLIRQEVDMPRLPRAAQPWSEPQRVAPYPELPARKPGEKVLDWFARLPCQLLLAIDPGDVHVGTAWFASWGEEDNPQRRCLYTAELKPQRFTDVLAEALIRSLLHTVVYEAFTLDPTLALEQSGSEMLTPQLIGVIRWMVKAQNRHADEHRKWEVSGRSLGLTCYRECKERPVLSVTLVRQMRTIKRPTRAILDRKGVPLTAVRTSAGGHCVDAELHGWHWILNPEPSRVESAT